MPSRVFALLLTLGFLMPPDVVHARSTKFQRSSPVGTVVSVGTSSVQIVAANARRRGIIFYNLSTTRTITIIPDNQAGPAVAGLGIVIPPQSQQPFIGDGKLINYNCGWNGVADGGNDASIEILELF